MKPGYKSTEFLLSAAAVLLGLLFASGLVGEGSGLEKVLSFAATVLTSLGYTVSRTLSKMAEVKAASAALGSMPKKSSK